MDEDTVSTNTSADDKTEDFCDNPTQDTIAEGLLGLIKPTVDLLDEKFRATRASQLDRQYSANHTGTVGKATARYC
ncbi:hypothetical protein M8J76_013998 [Diaphorina citri]|nr:hypothetical protein M8J76_013998 [Diaphorina citri]